MIYKDESVPGQTIVKCTKMCAEGDVIYLKDNEWIREKNNVLDKKSIVLTAGYSGEPEEFSTSNKHAVIIKNEEGKFCLLDIRFPTSAQAAGAAAMYAFMSDENYGAAVYLNSEPKLVRQTQEEADPENWYRDNCGG